MERELCALSSISGRQRSPNLTKIALKVKGQSQGHISPKSNDFCGHHSTYSSFHTKSHQFLITVISSFQRATQLCYRGLGSRNSVRLSVRPSVTCVLCDKIKQCTADILIPHERAITSFLTPTVVDGRRPLYSVWNLHLKWPTQLRQISAYNVSTARSCEKRSIMTNRKSTTGFSTSYRWSTYVTPIYKSPKEWLKTFLKI